MAGDSYTIATALSYAIVALERLPADWHVEDIARLRDLFDRIVPADFRADFLEVAREALDGKDKPRERPKLV